jgi:hypothetical protein
MADAFVSDKFAQVRGFSVEITGQTGKEVDNAWESVSGGLLTAPRAIGGDKFSTFSPGHKTVGEITLRGAMTDGRKVLCQWINDTVAGKPTRRDVAVKPIFEDGTVGDQVIFFDCVITGYVPPSFTVGDPRQPVVDGSLTEEVRFTYREWMVR